MILEEYIKEELIREKVEELGVLITNHYPKDTTLTIICVLKGSLLFAADLIRQIDLNTNLEFLDLSSYKGSIRGELVLNKDIDFSIADKNVLVIEDIVDSGNTINFIINEFKKRNPKSIKVASLLFKKDAYNFDMKIDWIGFNIRNEFIVGYGLDYNQMYRNKKSIYLIKDEQEK
tara:strand:- start:894 stop:1418 length:525 start_codon:yes stop_codon:yes gene_type:complete